MDVVVVAFPGNQFSGSILRGLNDLVQVRTVALLDLMFVDKDVDGAVGSMELAEIPDKYGSALVDASGAPRRTVGAWAVPFVSAQAASGAGGDRSGKGSPGMRFCPPSLPHRRAEETVMGLLGMMARTAVVAGTATVVSNNRVSRRQANRYAQKDQEQAEEEQQQQDNGSQQDEPGAQDDARESTAADPSMGDQLQ